MSEKNPWSSLPFFAAVVKLASSRFGGWFFVTVAPPIDRLLLKVSDGRLSLAGGFHTLILHTVGAKSGEPRETPLIYFPDGTRIVIIASRGGDTRHPGWYYNLRANPNAKIEMNGEVRSVVAHEAQGEERERLWKRAVAYYPGYETYQSRTEGRVIPVFVLE